MVAHTVNTTVIKFLLYVTFVVRYNFVVAISVELKCLNDIFVLA